ncbi:MAG: hypothetical protein FJZ01_00655 [Candidatus Sericytochromatia bacterium]|nr:hypothetical protein [Candidatus Tanganyikabacteria bacterium]
MEASIDFSRPFEAYGRRELLEWNAKCGREARGAKWRFLATLPEIDRVAAFRDAGFRSIEELAQVRGAVSERDVAETLRLHGYIGRFWVLWRLFAKGEVGLSKLLLVAPHVTADSAAWWAEQVQRCNRAQLRALVRALAAQCAEAAPASDSRTLPIQPLPVADESRTADRTASTPAPTARVGLSSGECGGGSLPPPPEEALPSAPSPQVASGGGATGARNPPPERPVRVRLTAELSVAGAKALDDLQDRWEREHGPLSRGEVIEKLAFEALSRVDAPADNPANLTATDGGASSDPEVEGSASGEAEIDRSLPILESEAAAVPGPGGSGEPARRPGAPRRLIEIVYREADTGYRWLPSRHGPVAVADMPAAIQDRLAGALSITLEELRARALAASARHERSLLQRMAARRREGRDVPADLGRDIPLHVEIYMMGRSGGRCESEGCTRRAIDLHHLDPFGETRRHDIDRMLALCAGHHPAYHSDATTPDAGDPRVLRAAAPGTEVRCSAVNVKVAACKRRALAGRGGAAAAEWA